MIRIRFHGRGGHGIKTASRIVGTAAFLAGQIVQDSPIYGAERRGASVAAFTRIDVEPILERGVIQRPELIVVADETLFEDGGAGVLRGQESASAVFANTTDAEHLRRQYSIAVPVVGEDLTSRTLAAFGHASALSAGLGAAAARLTGLVTWEQLQAALAKELGELGLSQEDLEKNEQIASAVFAALQPVRILPEGVEPKVDLVTIGYDSPLLGAPSILHPGNAASLHTGTWRVERPVIDRDRCTRCGLCWVRCPDGAIALDRDGYPVIDYDHCKGCLICRRSCPVLAIGETKETQAW